MLTLLIAIMLGNAEYIGTYNDNTHVGVGDTLIVCAADYSECELAEWED